MNKLKAVVIIIAGVCLAYLMLLAVMPALTSIVAESSAIVGAHPNIDLHPGAQEGLDIMPWVLYFLPGVIGIIALVITLRRGEE